MLCRGFLHVLRAWHSTLEAANVPLRPMARARTRANHLTEKVYIVIHFTRHLFADGVKNFKKTWSTIHKNISRFRLPNLPILNFDLCTLFKTGGSYSC